MFEQHDHPDMIMIIRHGEKPRAGHEKGCEPDGTHNPEALTTRGWQRAGALVGLFDPKGPKRRSELRRPDRIHATRKGPGGQHLRERQTVTPLADKLGLQVHHHHHVDELDVLTEQLLGLSGTTLICWEHKVLPRIAEFLGEVNPTPPTTWPDDRFDLVWVFTRSSDGWAFTQVPQLLLAGDNDSVIE